MLARIQTLKKQYWRSKFILWIFSTSAWILQRRACQNTQLFEFRAIIGQEKQTRIVVFLSRGGRFSFNRRKIQFQVALIDYRSINLMIDEEAVSGLIDLELVKTID